MNKWKWFVRSQLRRAGYDLVSFRPVSSLGCHLSDLLARFEIDLVIDVGAHQGEYATFLREIGYRGAIVSLEPVASNFEVLARRAAADPRWHARQFALGTATGEADLNVMSGTVLSSFLEPSEWGRTEYGEGIGVARVERVTIRALDDVFSELRAPSNGGGIMLKIDTQGYEKQVIDGARASLPSIAVLQAELPVLALYKDAESYDAMLRHVEPLGFEVSGLWPVAHDKSMRLIEMDCVFVNVAGP